MTTPNTPANAARETELSGKAEVRQIPQEYIEIAARCWCQPGTSHLVFNGDLATAFAVALEQAIERDRAERDAAPTHGILGHLIIPDDHPARAELVELRKQLAEREAELAFSRQRRQQLLSACKTCLADIKQANNVAEDLLKQRDELQAKLAEQSAALAKAKDAFRFILEECDWEGDARIGFTANKQIAIIAQIEALAGGTPSSGGKDGAK